VRRSLLLLLALPAAILAGCGQGGSGDDPGSLVPAESGIYADVVLDPEGDQERAVRSLVARFPGGDAGPTELLKRALDDSDDPVKLEDVQEWLGEDAVFFVRGIRSQTEAAAVLATTDSDAARDTIETAAEDEDAEERSHEGSDYWFSGDTAIGIVEDHVVVGTEPGFKAAAETAGGDSLTEQDDFEQAMDDLSDDRLATFFLDVRRLISASGGAAARSQLGPLLNLYKDPITLAVLVEDDAAVLESVLPESFSSFIPALGAGSELIGRLPAGSWLATGAPDLGEQLDSSLELLSSLPGGRDAVEQQLRAATGLGIEELLGWMGDFGLFARGTSLQQLGVGAVIETTDPAASRRVIETIARLARQSAGPDEQVGPLRLPGGGPGFTLTSPDLPGPVHVAQRGDRVVAALGDEAAQQALNPGRTLADDPGFDDAVGRLGEGYQASAVVEFGPILELAESLGAAQVPGYEQAKPYLQVFERLVAGAESEGEGRLTSRLRIELR
jgi:hypothetical protein